MISENQVFAALRELEQKVKLLKGDLNLSRKRVEELQNDNKKLRLEKQDQETEIKQLEKKQSDLEKNALKSKDFGKIVSNNLSGTDTNAELKQQLDEYIRELERCIAHLSSLS